MSARNLQSCFCCDLSSVDRSKVSFHFSDQEAICTSTSMLIWCYIHPQMAIKGFSNWHFNRANTAILIKKKACLPWMNCSSFDLWQDILYQSRRIAFSLFTFLFYVFWCSDMNSSYSTFYHHKLFEVQID